MNNKLLLQNIVSIILLFIIGGIVLYGYSRMSNEGQKQIMNYIIMFGD